MGVGSKIHHYQIHFSIAIMSPSYSVVFWLSFRNTLNIPVCTREIFKIVKIYILDKRIKNLNFNKTLFEDFY